VFQSLEGTVKSVALSGILDYRYTSLKEVENVRIGERQGIELGGFMCLARKRRFYAYSYLRFLRFGCVNKITITRVYKKAGA
jgi:hypothetical protein